MKLSLQVQYAICGLFDLAYNGQGDPVQVRVISDRQAIPARYLEQIFRRLRNADLMTSKRGPGGGYTLARAPRDITLRDIVEAVEGPLEQALEMDAAGEPPNPLRPSFLWGDLAERLGAALAETSLEEVCREAARSDVERAHPDAPMYFI
jgi:Rrf2 family iron-sulfur cluster assembly transcriptional regulator